jgi:AraC-like DNA-binding protein
VGRLVDPHRIGVLVPWRFPRVRHIHKNEAFSGVSETIAITDFDFETHDADMDALIAAWLPEIEAAAEVHVPDDRFMSFLVAGLRLGARSKSLKGFNMMEVINKAGYSRSTFFRLFEGYTGFLFKGYQLTCRLSVIVYRKHLQGRELSLDEFCTFTADVFYGANCSIPNEVIQMLWREHDLTHQQFHPHLGELAPMIRDYLAANPQTGHLVIDVEELDGVLKTLDLVILNARIEGDALWGTPFYYKKLRKMIKGYLITCA